MIVYTHSLTVLTILYCTTHSLTVLTILYCTVQYTHLQYSLYCTVQNTYLQYSLYCTVLYSTLTVLTVQLYIMQIVHVRTVCAINVHHGVCVEVWRCALVLTATYVVYTLLCHIHVRCCLMHWWQLRTYLNCNTLIISSYRTYD